MGTSYTPAFLSESVVYKITYSRFQQIMWNLGVSNEKSNVWTHHVAARTSSDDNKLVEFFRIYMLLTLLRLVLALKYN